MVAEKYLSSVDTEFCALYFQYHFKVPVDVIQEKKALNRNLAVFLDKEGSIVLLSSKQNKRVLSVRIMKNLKKFVSHKQNTFVRFWEEKYRTLLFLPCLECPLESHVSSMRHLLLCCWM
jgi:hypothetical protein